MILITDNNSDSRSSLSHIIKRTGYTGYYYNSQGIYPIVC